MTGLFIFLVREVAEVSNPQPWFQATAYTPTEAVAIVAQIPLKKVGTSIYTMEGSGNPVYMPWDDSGRQWEVKEIK